MRYDLLKAGAALAILAMTTPLAHAQGVRLSGSVSQEFRLDNNFSFNGAGTETRGYTRGGLTFSSETETTRVSASTSATMGMDPSRNFTFSTPSVRLDFSNRGRRTTTSAGVSYVTGPITFEEVQADLSLADETTDQTSIRGDFVVSTRLDNTKSTRFSARVSQLDFETTSAELVPSIDYSLDGALTYQRDRITSFDFTGSVGWFDGDGVEDSQSFRATVGVGVSRALNSNTELDADIGLAFVNTEETVLGVREEDWSLSVLFGAGISYGLADGAVDVGISQRIAPSSEGALAVNTGLTAEYSRQINESSAVAVTAAISRQETIGIGDDPSETSVSISPSYTRQIARDVEMEAAYTFLRDDSGDVSHGISIELEKVFDFPIN